MSDFEQLGQLAEQLARVRLLAGDPTVNTGIASVLQSAEQEMVLRMAMIRRRLMARHEWRPIWPVTR